MHGPLKEDAPATTIIITSKAVHVQRLAHPLLMHFRRADGCQQTPKSKPCTKGMVEKFNDTQTGMLLGIPRSARCVQRFDDSLEICNSHYLSQFAAFFIDARAKRSIAESCIVVLLNLGDQDNQA
jgi:hypothetical protein